MKIIKRDMIDTVLPSIDLLPAIEDGFNAYSRGEAVVPPVGELFLEKGEVHIKYGYIKGEEFYVVKVASGFYGNTGLGLPTGNGTMLLYRQDTGEPAGVLLDEGYLTDVRTAVAGAIAAKYLSPGRVERVGILGTGVQARLQLQYVGEVVDCRKVMVWGRGETQRERYRKDMTASGFEVRTTDEPRDILETCNLIVTTTPSGEPLIDASALRPGTHITAVGSDTPGKQELDTGILARADRVVADSIEQCLVRGEIHKALEAGAIAREDVVELGNVIGGRAEGRTADAQITVADLTGVAVQDIKIAEAVFRAVG
ncbi:MAG: ornithine cyclodeaminase family protein [Candidatus Latescibacterota bacterium]